MRGKSGVVTVFANHALTMHVFSFIHGKYDNPIYDLAQDLKMVRDAQSLNSGT